MNRRTATTLLFAGSAGKEKGTGCPIAAASACAPAPTTYIVDRVRQTVVETPAFAADARRAGLSEDERQEIAAFLADNPTAGDLIRGTGGARKVRFVGRGKGKSGGYRVITYYGGSDVPLFLLSVFSKGDRTDLDQAERNELRAILRELAEAYRRGARRT